MPKQIISLTTDFGLQDAFVGIMKGVILQTNPNAYIIDICHNITAYNIQEASFVISNAYQFFPEKTIHVVVIDPGVGSERRPILVKTPHYFFVAPDNGVLSNIYEEQPETRVFHLTNQNYFRSKVSNTFHGRDIFAQVAAWLSTGLYAEVFGPEIRDYLKMEILQPRCVSPNVFEFQIIHIDNFGNLITTIKEDFFQQALSQSHHNNFFLEIGRHRIDSLCTHFGSLSTKGQAGLIFGSTKNLEIFANQNRADQLLNVKVGNVGKITFF